MNKKIFLGGVIICAMVTGSFLWPEKEGNAACPNGETILSTQGFAAALKSFEFCAVSENEETAQIRLAQYYQDKENPTAEDKMKMIFYYHLAAENGNAHAQVSLAKHLMNMDKTQEDRDILMTYMEQMKTMLKNQNTLFKGEILHPYTLLLLASEDASQKWYYPTVQKSNGNARFLLDKMDITPEKKQEYMRQASQWKQQKMKETAQEVLSSVEYQQFMDSVYPQKGMADAYARSQAVERLKEKVNEYLK